MPVAILSFWVKKMIRFEINLFEEEEEEEEEKDFQYY
jgi:hypothetical protein